MAITITPSPSGVPPTTQVAHELEVAYAFFNRELFADRLPPCLITLQRRGRCTYGYFAPARFINTQGHAIDEIALNPRLIGARAFDDVMSTLAHEMTHAWQHHFGRRKSRSGYHNKEWAAEMLRIGLRPSHTGAAGGHMTGQQMSHVIMVGGRFAVSLERLRPMLPTLTWFDANPAEALPVGLADFDLAMPQRRLSGRRTVYRCPSTNCGQRAEGASDLHIICGHCEHRMEPIGQR